MSDLDHSCEVCGLWPRTLEHNLCPGCHARMYPEDHNLDGLKVRIAERFDTCMVCLQPIDLPGCCPRCARELEEDFEDLRMRGMA